MKMNEVNKTLYIPLYGKAKVSKKGIILRDPYAERIWEDEKFPIKGKSKSKWLTYNMAMRAKIFDEWTEAMLEKDSNALVLHIGCGLDSRFARVIKKYSNWFDGDFPEVIYTRKKYYSENDNYHMINFNASHAEEVEKLPDADSIIVIMEGISMYLKNEELNAFFKALNQKYNKIHILMDAYTVFGAKASKYKNPVNDVGVINLWGIDNIEEVLTETEIQFIQEHSLTPEKMINQLNKIDQIFFKLMFTGKLYSKIYRLFQLEK